MTPLIATSLASGSSGNALVLQYGADALLLDCGLPQRSIERALRQSEIDPATLRGVLLTHEHGDHACSAAPFAKRHGLPLVASAPTLAAIGAQSAGLVTIAIAPDTIISLGSFRVECFHVAHDAAGPVGYCIAAGGWCVGIATDLGAWDASVAAALRMTDLLIVEANYDAERLRLAPYNEVVKYRIAGSNGHLDNIDAARLIARIAADGRQRTVWLAHLSQEANSPQVAARTVAGALRLAGARPTPVFALPRRAPHTWSSETHARQLDLFPIASEEATDDWLG